MHSIVAKRLLALAIDWLLICGYLILLALFALGMYLIFWDRIPTFSHLLTQVIATLTTVVPIICWCSWKESRIPFATTGKIQAELTVKYRGDAVTSAVIRNSLKFLPWQLAHIGVIHGMYTDFESSLSMLLILIALFLALTYVMQVVVTPSHRHLPDIIAKARVVQLPS